MPATTAFLRRWGSMTPDQVLEYKRAHYAANVVRYRELQTARDRKRRAARAARCLARKALKLGRIPKWADLAAIDAVYAEADRRRELGEDVHVDHQVPLQGRTVSGFHVAHNLQIIPATDNHRKGNRFWPDM